MSINIKKYSYLKHDCRPAGEKAHSARPDLTSNLHKASGQWPNGVLPETCRGELRIAAKELLAGAIAPFRAGLLR